MDKIDTLTEKYDGNKKIDENMDGIYIFSKIKVSDRMKQEQQDIAFVMNDKGERITDKIARLPWISAKNTSAETASLFRSVDCYYESEKDVIILIPRCIVRKVDIIRFIYDMLDGKYSSKKEMVMQIDCDMFDTIDVEIDKIKKTCYFIVESVAPRSNLVIGISMNINEYKNGFDMDALRKIVYDN